MHDKQLERAGRAFFMAIGHANTPTTHPRRDASFS